MRAFNVFAFAWLSLMVVAGTAAAAGGPGISTDQTLQKLTDGNRRYVAAKSVHPNQTAARRADVAEGQHPFAVIVSCSDSRVPPEVVFDQGVGDLFVVRVAGHIVDDVALGSIEYAVAHLGAPLIVVLGHERCGAVDAAVKGGEAHGHIGSLVEAIQPAVKKAKGRPGDALDNAVRANVKYVVGKLRSAGPFLDARVRKGALKIVGARYDLDDGKVEVMP